LFSKLGLLYFYFYFINDLLLNDITFVLGADMNVNVLVATHIKYVKLLILKEKVIDRGAHLKFVQKT